MTVSDSSSFDSIVNQYRLQNKKKPYLKITREKDYLVIDVNYFIGVNWLGDTSLSNHVEPKINTKHIEQFNDTLENEDDSNKKNSGSNKQENSTDEVFELDFCKC